MKAPKNYHIVSTQDGSQTLYSELYNENCHSEAGAVEETKLHYLKACQVLEKSKEQKEISILEIGFGLGIGWETTFHALKNDSCHLSFLSVEIDPELVAWAMKERSLPTHGLEILVGDARETLKAFQKQYPQRKFDCIYQDAFSPRRNPELWTVEWFTLLRSLSHSQTIMSTYSASSSVRKSMIEAGWILREGHKFGPKRSATIAFNQGEQDPVILDKLERSPAIVLREENIDEYRRIK